MSQYRRLAILFLVLVYTMHGHSTIHGQNLVQNPGFEEYRDCPPMVLDPEFVRTSHHWTLVIGYWTDAGQYIHKDCFPTPASDPYYMDAIDSLSIDIPRGDGFLLAGCYSLNSVGQLRPRIYYANPLILPMQQDSLYYVSYLYHANRRGMIIDHYGVTFVQDTADVYADLSYNYYAAQDFVGFRDTFYGPDTLYHRIEGCYEADGGEQWLVMGTFLDDTEIGEHPHRGYFSTRSATVNVDDFKVYKVPRPRPEQTGDLIACDGDEVLLADPVQTDVWIIDATGTEVDRTIATWPDTQHFIYTHPCADTLSIVRVIGAVCDSPHRATYRVCQDSLVDIDALLPAGYLTADGSTDLKATALGSYTIPLMHDRYGDFGAITIEALACEDCRVFTPNALYRYSAVGNDCWRPLTPCTMFDYQLAIYNRWGGKVFSSQDQGACWQPTLADKVTPAGAYTFDLQYRFYHPLDEKQDVQQRTGLIYVY